MYIDSTRILDNAYFRIITATSNGLVSNSQLARHFLFTISNEVNSFTLSANQKEEGLCYKHGQGEVKKILRDINKILLTSGKKFYITQF